MNEELKGISEECAEKILNRHSQIEHQIIKWDRDSYHSSEQAWFKLKRELQEVLDE